MRYHIYLFSSPCVSYFLSILQYFFPARRNDEMDKHTELKPRCNVMHCGTVVNSCLTRSLFKESRQASISRQHSFIRQIFSSTIATLTPNKLNLKNEKYILCNYIYLYALSILTGDPYRANCSINRVPKIILYTNNIYFTR